MKKFNTYKIFSLYRSILPICVIICLTAGCSGYFPPPPQNAPIVNDKYSTDKLAKQWREQVRKNPNNPYEGMNYPMDNDADYTPVKRGQINQKNHSTTTSKKNSSQNTVYKNNIPSYGDEDTYYGKFPKYNPEDDNVYLDAKDYPLYLDYQ